MTDNTQVTQKNQDKSRVKTQDQGQLKTQDKNQVKTQDTAEQTPMVPAVDVFEDASGIILCADLPGVPKDKLSLHIKDGALTIEGEIALGTPEGMEAVHAEVGLPRYERTFTLSKELDTEKVEARFEAGVLTLRIPKAEHAQSRRIEIQAS
jgi:HSP20 family molecular chaperone IbpA